MPRKLPPLSEARDADPEAPRRPGSPPRQSVSPAPPQKLTLRRLSIATGALDKVKRSSITQGVDLGGNQTSGGSFFVRSVERACS